MLLQPQLFDSHSIEGILDSAILDFAQQEQPQEPYVQAIGLLHNTAMELHNITAILITAILLARPFFV